MHRAVSIAVVAVVAVVIIAYMRRAQVSRFTDMEKRCPRPPERPRANGSKVQPKCLRECRIGCDGTGGGPICYTLCKDKCVWP